MSIILELSSQLKINSNEPNKLVARKCISDPVLLDEIITGFNSKDKKLVGDCIEVFTEIALTNPELIIKYIHDFIPLINHKETRIRWEAMHSLALTAHLVPDVIFKLLTDIMEIIRDDKSIVVRDYSIETIVRYAATSKQAALEAFPMIEEILDLWKERHAARIIEGLIHIQNFIPNFADKILNITDEYLESQRSSVKKAAIKLQKIIKKKSI